MGHQIVLRCETWNEVRIIYSFVLPLNRLIHPNKAMSYLEEAIPYINMFPTTIPMNFKGPWKCYLDLFSLEGKLITSYGIKTPLLPNLVEQEAGDQGWEIMLEGKQGIVLMKGEDWGGAFTIAIN